MSENNDRRAKHADLRRRQAVALALLCVAAAVFIVTTVFQRGHGYGLIGLVRAMAEAALIGGLADWYAIVALFRHPLHLRLPHTAIIPRKKDAIGRSLADFICQHFLEPAYIVERIRVIDPAERLAAYLSRPESAKWLADITTTLALRIINVLDSDALRHALWRMTRAKLARLDLADLLARLLEALSRDGGHREAVDSLLDDVADYINRPDVRDLLAQKIADELWSVVRWINLEKMLADKLANKVATATRQLIREMARDGSHPLRQRFDERIPEFIDRLRTDDAVRVKVQAFRDRMIGNREVADVTHELYQGALDWLRRDLAAPHSRFRPRLAAASMALGRQLAANDELKAKLNHWLAGTIAPLANAYRDDIRDFIVARVEAWSADELTEQLELAIGADLQWILYNGTSVGAIIGALLYDMTWLLHLAG
jgi:uncharacterized membrane-anchored protein YjiN (DUF445 family)